MTLGQARYFHGVLLKGFMEYLGIEVTKETMNVVKTMFKKHLSVQKTSKLEPPEYSTFISQTISLMASEWGYAIEGEDRTDMKDFLKMVYSYDERKLTDDYDTNSRHTGENL